MKSKRPAKAMAVARDKNQFHTYDLVVCDPGDSSVGIPSLTLPIKISVPAKEKDWLEKVVNFEVYLKDFLTELFCECGGKVLTAEQHRNNIEAENDYFDPTPKYQRRGKKST